VSAQLEDVTEQMSFEGMPIQSTRLGATISDIDCRIDGEPLALSFGDRVTITCEVEIDDIGFKEKRKFTIDETGRTTGSVGVGSRTRKHGGTLVPGTATITSVTRRESDEDRVRRLTR
jgi:hypothetical protein